MKLRLILYFILIFFANSLNAQKERKFIREGVKEYKEDNYSDSEVLFKEALEIDSTSIPATYNMANSLYKQNKFQEASSIFNELSANVDDKSAKADMYHNIGNSFLKQKKYEQSIEAYKNSLRIRPEDEETRYNLAYAKQMLEQQQQQQQNNQNNNQDKQEQKNNKDDQQQENQDQQQQQQEQQQNNQEQQQENQQEEEQQSQPMKKGLSREEMERMLQAIQQKEKNVKEEIDKEKVKAAKTKSEKDW